MNINEFRQQYPEYNDMSDATIVDKFHSKYYSDMPKEEFVNKFLGTVYPDPGKADLQAQEPPQNKSIGSSMWDAFVNRTKSAGKNFMEGIVKQNEAIAKGDVNATLERILAISPGGIATTKSVVGPAVGNILSSILGKTTGAGKEAVKSAYEGGKTFVTAMRGGTTIDDALNLAKETLSNLRAERGANYAKQLADIAQQGNVVIDNAPVMAKVQDLMNRFRVGIVQGKKGPKLDFNQSTLDRSARKPMNDLIADVTNWTDWSPVGADALKKRIDDFYAPTSNSRVFATELKNIVKSQIINKVPEYQKMLKDYEEVTSALSEIDRALSTGAKANRDTALRKLATINRDVNTYRKGQLGKLDEMGGTDINAMLAGTAMNPVMPRGQLAGAFPATGIGIASFYNPAVLSLLPTLSPRAVGEIANIAGKASGKGLDEILRRATLYEGGRLQNQ